MLLLSVSVRKKETPSLLGAQLHICILLLDRFFPVHPCLSLSPDRMKGNAPQLPCPRSRPMAKEKLTIHPAMGTLVLVRWERGQTE